MADDGGSTFGLTPCAMLIATASELRVRGTRGDFRVPKTAVRRIGGGRLYPWFFRAVQIHHAQPNCSRELQFKPLQASRREIFERLRELGYPVA